MAQQRLVDVRVEAPVGVDLGEPVPLHEPDERLVDEAHALLELGLLVLGGRLERALQVVEHGQQLVEQPLVGPDGERRLLAGDALAVVVEVRGDAPQVVHRLFLVALQILDACEELVGQADPDIVMGKGSGLDSVSIWLGRNDIFDAETKEIETILAEVKGRSLAKKGLLGNDEFMEIVREVIPDKID